MSAPALKFSRSRVYCRGAAVPLLAGALVMTASLSLAVPLRAVVELPFALLLPGASILAAARGRQAARPASDIGLVVVLSFGVLIVISLACYVISQPLTTAAFTVGLDLLVVGCAAVCAVRKAPLSTLVGDDVGAGLAGRILAVAFAVGACCAVLVIGTRAVAAPEPYSSIALAGQWAGVGSSVAVTPGAPVAVEIAVSNHTRATKTYRLIPSMADASWRPRTFQLAPGKSWRGHVRGTVPAGGCLHRLLVSVRDSAAHGEVGSVSLWFQNGMTLPRECTP